MQHTVCPKVRRSCELRWIVSWVAHGSPQTVIIYHYHHVRVSGLTLALCAVLWGRRYLFLCGCDSGDVAASGPRPAIFPHRCFPTPPPAFSLHPQTRPFPCQNDVPLLDSSCPLCQAICPNEWLGRMLCLSLWFWQDAMSVVLPWHVHRTQPCGMCNVFCLKARQMAISASEKAKWTQNYVTANAAIGRMPSKSGKFWPWSKSKSACSLLLFMYTVIGLQQDCVC
jgi:hypothetical protein